MCIMEPLKVPDPEQLGDSQGSVWRAGVVLVHNPRSLAVVEGCSMNQYLQWCSSSSRVDVALKKEL